MKATSRNLILAIATLSLAGAGSAIAQPGTGFGPGADGADRPGFDRPSSREDGLKQHRQRGQNGPRDGAGFRERMTQQFDTDGDGTLSEQERQAARESFGDRQGQQHSRRGEGRNGERGQANGRRHGRHGQRHRLSPEAREQFDTDGDGTLSTDERQAAREHFHGQMTERREARRAEMLERFDNDGDGTLSQEEREAARDQFRTQMQERREARRDEFIAQFDTDGDGTLSDEERQAAREARPQGEGHRGRRGHGRRGSRMSPEQMTEFDADLNGSLDSDERKTARDTLQQRRRTASAIRALDTDGDGTISESEAADGIVRIEAGEKIADVNGDGVVDRNDVLGLVGQLRKQN